VLGEWRVACACAQRQSLPSHRLTVDCLISSQGVLSQLVVVGTDGHGQLGSAACRSQDSAQLRASTQSFRCFMRRPRRPQRPDTNEKAARGGLAALSSWENLRNLLKQNCWGFGTSWEKTARKQSGVGDSCTAAKHRRGGAEFAFQAPMPSPTAVVCAPNLRSTLSRQTRRRPGCQGSSGPSAEGLNSILFVDPASGPTAPRFRDHVRRSICATLYLDG
jgi:hypothetical protein